jgi:hypothetical protein
VTTRKARWHIPASESLGYYGSESNCRKLQVANLASHGGRRHESPWHRASDRHYSIRKCRVLVHDACEVEPCIVQLQQRQLEPSRNSCFSAPAAVQVQHHGRHCGGSSSPCQVTVTESSSLACADRLWATGRRAVGRPRSPALPGSCCRGVRLARARPPWRRRAGRRGRSS